MTSDLKVRLGALQEPCDFLYFDLQEHLLKFSSAYGYLLSNKSDRVLSLQEWTLEDYPLYSRELPRIPRRSAPLADVTQRCAIIVAENRNVGYRDLFSLFKEFGKVENIRSLEHPETCQPLGIVIVEFATEEAANLLRGCGQSLLKELLGQFLGVYPLTKEATGNMENFSIHSIPLSPILIYLRSLTMDSQWMAVISAWSTCWWGCTIQEYLLDETNDPVMSNVQGRVVLDDELITRKSNFVTDSDWTSEDVRGSIRRLAKHVSPAVVEQSMKRFHQLGSSLDAKKVVRKSSEGFGG